MASESWIRSTTPARHHCPPGTCTVLPPFFLARKPSLKLAPCPPTPLFRSPAAVRRPRAAIDRHVYRFGQQQPSLAMQHCRLQDLWSDASAVCLGLAYRRLASLSNPKRIVTNEFHFFGRVRWLIAHRGLQSLGGGSVMGQRHARALGGMAFLYNALCTTSSLHLRNMYVPRPCRASANLFPTTCTHHPPDLGTFSGDPPLSNPSLRHHTTHHSPLTFPRDEVVCWLPRIQALASAT
ncbi:hypothetical protein EV126DRAFT_214546 [Verticillium dahliae]|nr:hypothetical protein EV126DRAFT_214546 [Verticillium dahliae]